MNLTQTGMNTSGEPFQFSFDNDRNDQDSLVQLLYQAQVEGWKVKLKYHAVWGLKNVFHNRGETDYFIDDVEVLDKAKEALDDAGKAAEGVMDKVQDFLKKAFGPKDEGQA